MEWVEAAHKAADKAAAEGALSEGREAEEGAAEARKKRAGLRGARDHEGANGTHHHPDHHHKAGAGAAS
jgi:hypothetical protein